MTDAMPAIRSILGMPQQPHPEGVNRALPAWQLPAGWVAVVEYDLDGNVQYECSGFLDSEYPTALFVWVSGKLIGFVKNHCTVTRAVES